MGDDLSLPGRMSVRTPMQWSDGPNGGFSAAPAERLVRPVVSEGEFGFARVNVEAQRSDPGSLLNFMVRLIRTRKECPELGEGEVSLLDSGDPCVFAHSVRWKGERVVAIHNLSALPRTARLQLGEEEPSRLVDLLGDRPYEPIRGPAPEVRLEGYGYRWLRSRPLPPPRHSA